MRKLITEAEIQFELYRLIRNLLPLDASPNGLRYMRIDPEVVVKGDAADLVVRGTDQGVNKNVIVIEVKKPSKRDLLAFGSHAKEQAMGYALNLQAPFYMVTDGNYLRLFKSPNTPMGDHAFRLNESDVRVLLTSLAQIWSGLNNKLPFESVRPPNEEIEEMRSASQKYSLIYWKR